MVFSRLSTDGEEGYPGNLMVSVKYTFTNKGRLVIRYKALADRDTVVNLTNHTYFNLNGHDSGSVNGQYLHIWADSFTENDSDCLPTGRVVSLDSEEGKAMDFREDRTIGEKIEENNIHLKTVPVMTITIFWKIGKTGLLQEHTARKVVSVWNVIPHSQEYSFIPETF